MDQTSAGNVWTAQNLITTPNSIVEDGISLYYEFGVQSCSVDGSGCSYSPNIGYINANPVCPDGSGAGTYATNGTNRLIACAKTVYDVQPPPKNCKTCFGDSIYAATGQKAQVETDYSSASGLGFTRTYRSNNGFVASTLTQSFVDNSLPAGATSTQCYPAHWTYGSANGSSCFPYISVFPNVNNGVPLYQLQTEDGRSIAFSGPNTAVTQAADINDRVTQIAFNGASAWQVKREDDSVETYNSSGVLLQKTLRGGKVLTYVYSTSSTPLNVAPYPGLLLTQSDAFGHTLNWQYNSSGQMSQMTDPAGGIYQYTYTTGQNVTRIMYPDGSSKSYWYNESANTGGANLPTALTGITDENGVRYATFQYNSAGLAVSTQHAGGVESYTFNYPYTAFTGQNYTATVTDPLGTARTYNFRENYLSYNLDTSQAQPAASGTGTVTQSETYDANGNPATLSDFNGNVTYSVYDLTRNLETSRTEAYGTSQARTITTTWDPNWRKPDLITEPNRTTAFTYDSLGNVLAKTITDISVTPNVARTWTYTYDSYGRLLSAQGLTTFNTYNAHGQPLTMTDPNGVVTTLTYDLRQRLTSRRIGTETTAYSYTPTGLLQTVTLPDTSTITYGYDAAHRLTDITDGIGDHIHYTLDNLGNRAAENTYDPSSTLKRTHTRVINTLNELSQEINAAGTAAVTTTLAYDNNGNVLSSAAPLSRNTVNQYDALNRLQQITDPNAGITQLGYDANDNLQTVIDPRNLTTTYTHNGFGDVTQLVSPDTGTSLSTYDSGGNLKTSTDARGAVATYTYDALNRVSQVVYPDQTINLSYDAGTNGVGRLAGASDANHSLSWTYDALGRVTGKGQTIGTVTKSVGYAYANGDLTSLVTPTGQTLVYGYTNHRITSITVNGTTILSGATYDPFGPATSWTWGNGTSASRAFDQDGNLTQLQSAGETYSYSYDDAFRIIGIANTAKGNLSWSYGYDSLDRLSSANTSALSESWTYDANGNRLTQGGTYPMALVISPTSNQITSGSSVFGGGTGTYDASGNTTQIQGNTASYNGAGRMSSANFNGATAQFIYNALGERIYKNASGSGVTLFMYDEGHHLIGEYGNSGNLIEETVWMDDTPVATLRPSGAGIAIYYVHTIPRAIFGSRDHDRLQLPPRLRGGAWQVFGSRSDWARRGDQYLRICRC